MTSQLLLMNSRGVTFASDSASSSGRFSTNSVQKIFSLPGRQPIAFMVSGSAIYAPSGLSWDRIFYKYNDYYSEKFGKNEELKTISDYETDFLQFLRTMTSNNANNMHLSYDLYTYFAGNQGLLTKYEPSEYEPSDNANKLSEKLEKLRIHLEKIFQNLSDLSDIDSQIKIKQINESHGEMLDLTAESIIHSLMGIEASDAPDLTGMVRALLLYHTVHHGKDMSWRASTTTLVFGGFSKDEENPSTIRIKVGTMIHGNESNWIVDRNIVSDESDINPRTSNGIDYHSRVFIEGFAQCDMIQRLTHGADPRLGLNRDENTVSRMAGVAVYSWLDKYAVEELTKLHGIGATKAEEIKQHLLTKAGMASEVEHNHWNWFNGHINDTKKEFRGAIDRLSSIELAELSGYLIEIQAKMYQYIRPQATVSIPVDVCYLTKEQGFIWHKLKNTRFLALDKELNPKFYNLER